MSTAFEINRLTPKEIPIIQQLSHQIWKKVYPSIISMQQIEYMLDMIYNETSLLKQMTVLGHQFITLTENEHPIGYASYSIKAEEQNGTFRLHKFYLQPSHHGKGLGKMMLNYIVQEIIAQKGSAIELNVNKYNPTLGFYRKLGFSIISEEVIDIGSGYVMDDYIMRLSPLKYPL